MISNAPKVFYEFFVAYNFHKLKKLEQKSQINSSTNFKMRLNNSKKMQTTNMDLFFNQA